MIDYGRFDTLEEIQMAKRLYRKYMVWIGVILFVVFMTGVAAGIIWGWVAVLVVLILSGMVLMPIALIASAEDPYGWPVQAIVARKVKNYTIENKKLNEVIEKGS